MLQIITGRFFEDGKVNEQECNAILYSNYSWIGSIDSSVASLRPAAPLGSTISSYVLRYTGRYEQRPADTLVMPACEEAAEQFRLLAGLWFQAQFHHDRYHVEMLCRHEARNATREGVPAQFVKAFFKPRFGKAAEIEGFSRFMDKVLAMPRVSFRSLLSCLAVFFDALEAIDTNRDLAYSMFVYVLEALAQSTDMFVPTWEDFPQNTRVRLDGLFAAISADQTQSIKQVLLDNPNLKLKKRFIEFTARHVHDHFFTIESNGHLNAIRKNELIRALGNLYDARSGFVHALTPIQQHVRMPNWGAGADVLHWEHEPILTFSGVVRLIRHVLLQFVDKAPVLSSEIYPNWRHEVPGIVEARLAPQLWIHRFDNLTPQQAVHRFNGLYSHLASHLPKSPLEIPNLKGVVEKIEELVPQASPQDRKTWLSFYRLFNRIVGEEHCRPKWQQVVSNYRQLLEQCSIEFLAEAVMLDESPHWPLAECLDVYQRYLRSKFRPNAINLPKVFEVAILSEIANRALAGDMLDVFTKCLEEALVTAAGLEEVQRHLSECRDQRKRIDTSVVLRMPGKDEEKEIVAT